MISKFLHANLEMGQEWCKVCPCCPACLLMYFNDNTAYLLEKRHPSIVTAQELWIPIWMSLCIEYLALKSLLHAGVTVDSGKYLHTCDWQWKKKMQL